MCCFSYIVNQIGVVKSFTTTLTKIPSHVSFRLRHLFQDKGVRGKIFLKLYTEYLRTSLYRHAVKSIDSTQVVDKRKFNKGRPRKVSLREERIILREIRKLKEDLGHLLSRGYDWFVD